MIAKQLAFAYCISLLHFCIGMVWQPATYPGPKACKMDKRWVCDPDSVISKSEVDQLDTLLQDIREKTKSPCTGKRFKGFDVRVAIADEIEMLSSVETSTETFVNFVREKTLKSSTSRSSCDDYVLVMLFRDARYVQIATGARAEKLIPNEELETIKAQTKDDLAAGRFALGLRKILEELYQRLSKQPRLQQPPIAMARRGGSSSRSRGSRSMSFSSRRRSSSSGGMNVSHYLQH